MAESVHAVAACVSDRDGRLAGESSPGAAALEVFVRSAAKPFQALAAVRADALEALGLGDRHLAVACASHDSSEERVLLVQEILATAGLGEDALACGIAAPLDGRVAREIGDDIRPVHHNCSGKHALGLVLCVHEGWPTDDYLEPALGPAELSGALESTFGIVENVLDGWTLEMLEEEISRPEWGADWVHTRGSVLQRVFSHDIWHAAELNESLVANGLPPIDLWD